MKAILNVKMANSFGEHSRNLMSMFMLLTGALFLTGCASTTETLQTDSIQFKGDAAPLVTSSSALARDFTNLSEGETVVVGLSPDGSGAVSQPNIATVDVSIDLLRNARSSESIELLLNRCDPDRDGVWDVYCPELLNVKLNGQLSHEKHVIFQSSYSISRDNKGAQGFSRAYINKSREKTNDVPLYLELLSINRGNKVFKGDLNTYINIPPQVEMGELLETKKVRDQTGTKQALSWIPYVNLIALNMSDFKSVTTNAEFEIYKEEERRYRVVAKGIELRPGDGIKIKYSTHYKFES